MARPDSIRAKGLAYHLDATKAEHNNLGLEDLHRYLEHGDEFGDRMSIVRLSKRFNVSRTTMEKWLLIYDEEKKDGLPRR